MRKLSTFDRPSQTPPRIITARAIHLADDAATTATAMLIVRGWILAVGSLADCEGAAMRSAFDPERVDLGEAVIVPGFVDAHAHPLMYGQLMTWVDCGPEKAGSIPEIVALLRAAATDLPEGRPVRGYGYEHRNLAEQRHPTRFELDEVASDREVYLMNASGHGGVVNSYTFARNGIDRDTPNPDGGEIFRDADGELTGEI